MTINTKIIRGAGGGGDQSKKPTIQPDNLHSRQFATVQDLLSEGEIEGSATASKAGLTKGTTAYNNAFLIFSLLEKLSYIRSINMARRNGMPRVALEMSGVPSSENLSSAMAGAN